LSTLKARNIRQYLTGPKIAPYVFISPFYILWAIFGVFPIVYSIWLSLHRVVGIYKADFVGFYNFREVFLREDVIKAFYNSIWYAVVNIIGQITIALLIAVLINSKFVKLKGFFRIGYYVPNMVSTVAAGILFSILFQTNGLLNMALNTNVTWLHSTFWSKPVVMAVVGWRWIGYWIIIFSAALQGIPDFFYEAASIDGANSFQKFWHITLPSLRHVMLFAVVINTIGGFHLFGEPYIVFTAKQSPVGPLNSALTPVIAIYKAAFENFELGFAAAIAWVLAIITILATGVQINLWKKER